VGVERLGLGERGDLHLLGGSRGGKYPSGNSLLLEDDLCLVVDPSLDVAEAGASVTSRKVDLVINSHAHEDHFAGNSVFEDAELLLHENDAPLMASLDALMAGYGMDEEFDTLWRQVTVDKFNFRPRPDARSAVDGEVVDTGRNRVHLLHTPGHTAGHLVVRFEPDDIVFVGDLDLTAFGPYYADASASLDETVASLEMLRDMAPGLRAFVSFHEAGVIEDDLVGAVDRYLAVVDHRDRRLLELTEEPRSLGEIARECVVYGKRYEHIPWQPFVERVMMERHAERLIARGELTREEDGRFRRV
jgi:glyoxylase-like metal-dependent hydrolase (beta-lactamase superfamily II)